MYNYHDKRSSRLEKSASVGGISQISMENDADILDADLTADLKYRLDELEGITLSFLSERPLKLTTANDTFADIDAGETQQFELYIPEFSRNDVLCVDIGCLPDTVMGNFETHRYSKIDHQPLVVSLKTAPLGSDREPPVRHISTTNSFLPSYHNGEYEFCLTSSHGITPGLHILSVVNQGAQTQSVRAHLSLHQYVSATPIQPGETITKRGVKTEFTYFRYLRRDPSELISVRVSPLDGEGGGSATDPDLYISNKYSGLVCVSGDNYVWRSSKVGADQIDIHPSEDINARRGDTFIIGVRCQKDRVGNFEIKLNCSYSPPEHIDVLRDSAPMDLSIRHDSYTYLRVPVDVNRAGKLILTVTPLAPTQNGISTTTADISAIEQQFGRGVYAVDSLVSGGGLFSLDGEHKHDGLPTVSEAIAAQQTGHHSSSSEIGQKVLGVPAHLSVPESVAKATGLFPLAFLSASCMYPIPETATWRASSLHGDLLVYIESDEWKYADKATCYIALIGVALPGQSCGEPPPPLRCRVVLEERLDIDELSLEMKSRYKLYADIFADIDGANISQMNRSLMASEPDQQALTYGEIELLECIRMLQTAGARDNQIFVDLGCGVAKTLVAAAFSGTKFIRCVGVEVLPQLCEAARAVILKTKNMIRDFPSKQTQDPGLASLKHNFPLLEIWEGDASDDSSLGMASWTDADVVYAASICFPDSLMQKLIDIARGLKPGSIFITLKLPERYSEWFVVERKEWFKMSWGRVMAYFLRRNDEDASS